MDTLTASNCRGFDGKFPQLGERVWIDPSAVVLGDLILGDDTSVWPQVSIRADVNTIRVGDRTSIQDGCVLHVTHKSKTRPNGWPLQIGREVTVGHNAILHGCTVGDRVIVGMGAVVMDGVTVQSDVVIAAGALVTPGKTLSSGKLYAGSPAREVRALTQAEMAYFSYSADNYVNLKDRYRSVGKRVRGWCFSCFSTKRWVDPLS